MKVDNDNIMRLKVISRDVHERAVIVAYTSPNDKTYEDRIEWLRIDLETLLLALEVKE